MSKKEYLKVGYIRTSCYSKILYLIDGLPVSKLYISRSYQDARKEETGLPWLVFKLRGYRDLKVQWELTKHRISFQKVLDKINEMMNEYDFGDFIVEKLQILLTDKTLNKMIGKHVEIKDGDGILATFINHPIAIQELDGWDAKVVTKINEKSIKNLGFKRGTLDLREIYLFRDGKIEDNLSELLNEEEVIEQIIRNLNRSIWDNLPEMITLLQGERENGNNMKAIDPGALRTYEKTSGTKWKFISDRGIH